MPTYNYQLLHAIQTGTNFSNLYCCHFKLDMACFIYIIVPENSHSNNISRHKHKVIRGFVIKMTKQKNLMHFFIVTKRNISSSSPDQTKNSVLSIQQSVFSNQYSLLNIQYSIINIQYSAFNTQYSVLSIHWSVFSIQYSLFSTPYSVFSGYQLSVISTQ